MSYSMNFVSVVSPRCLTRSAANQKTKRRITNGKELDTNRVSYKEGERGAEELYDFMHVQQLTWRLQ